MLLDSYGILSYKLFVEKFVRVIEFQMGITYIILESKF
jgi:hypothetical protein